MLFISTAFAQAAAGAAKPGTLEMFFPLIVIMAVFYFLVARPQQRKAKEHQKFLVGLKKGDSVITSGGVFGEVYGITDLFVTLQIADNTRIKILRSQIARLSIEETKK